MRIEGMRKPRRAGLAVAVALLAVSTSAQNKKEFSSPLNAGASVTIVNEYGAINVQPAPNAKLVITAVPHSNKVEVDFQNNANSRVEARTHVLQNGNADEIRVDYEVRLPAGASINVRSSNGPMTVDGINADITCAGESAPVQVRNG